MRNYLYRERRRLTKQAVIPTNKQIDNIHYGSINIERILDILRNDLHTFEYTEHLNRQLLNFIEPQIKIINIKRKLHEDIVLYKAKEEEKERKSKQHWIAYEYKEEKKTHWGGNGKFEPQAINLGTTLKPLPSNLPLLPTRYYPTEQEEFE